MSHPMNRLEEALIAWEDQFFVDSVLTERGLISQKNVKIPHGGPLKHWQELRAHLLEVGGGAAYDPERFDSRLAIIQDRYGGAQLVLPYYLAAWTRHSRRVFHLSEEVQALLTAMSFGEMRWTDILLPFSSFLITLEQPLVCGEDRYDALLVVRQRHEVNEECDLLIVTLFSQNLEQRKQLSLYDKRSWREAVRKGKFSMETWKRLKGSKLAVSIEARMDWKELEAALTNIPVNQVVHPRVEDTPAGAAFSPDGAEARVINTAFQILAGLCLYLTSLPSGSPHRSEWSPAAPSGKPDPRAITRGAQVCKVTSSFTLSPDERKAYLGISSGSGSELCAHFRRGHFRRLPGKGNDPTAPKVVLVKPALVRGDRLAPGELPGGSLARVKL